MVENMLGIAALMGYLIGSIPSGFLLARLHGIADIREYGSGNIGATNVARVLGIKYFFIVFFLDFIKAYAYLQLLFLWNCNPLHLIAAASALLLGNAFPLFLNFRGGKGVATSFGVLLALQPSLVFYAAICWTVVFAYTRIVGIASVITLLLLPLCSVFMAHDSSSMSLFVIAVSLWGIALHHNNIKNFYATVR